MDREGRPLGGQIPMEVRYSGGGNYQAVSADVGAILRSFLQNVRQSTANEHIEDVPLPGGGNVSIVARFGTVTVDVYVPPTGGGGEGFYGGILINPNIIFGDEAAFLSGAVAATPATLGVPTEIKSAGAPPGRPAVPGTATTDQTEWLVCQIHPTKSLALADDPIGKGVVKFFRIHNPLFGTFASVPRTDEYVVSTRTGAEFYVCGKKMTHVPPLPITLSDAYDPMHVRIRTYGLRVPSFARAAETDAVIIVAAVNRLYVINTAARTPPALATWQLLETATIPGTYPAQYRPNDFASTFTEERVSDGVRITCAGSNALGACSGFTVTLLSSGPHSGSLSLVNSGFVAGRTTLRTTLDRAGEYLRSPSAPVTDTWPVRTYKYTNTGFPTAFDYTSTETVNRYVSYEATGFSEAHTSTILEEGPVWPIEYDTFLGGVIPTPLPYLRQYDEYGETLAVSLDGYEYRLKGAGLLVDGGMQTAAADYPGPSHLGGTPAGQALDPTPGDLWWAPPFLDFEAYYASSYTAWQTMRDLETAAVGPSPIANEYRSTYEVNGLFSPWNDGPSSTDNPSTRLDVPASSLARCFPFFDPDYHDLDVGDEDFGKYFYPGVPPFEIDESLLVADEQDHYVQRVYAWGGTGAPSTDGTLSPAPTDWFVYDSHGIWTYPKRAAVFSASESYDVTDTYTNSFLPRALSCEKSRVGKIFADEYYAHPLATNVPGFPDNIVSETLTDNRIVFDSGSFGWDPYARNRYTAREYHTNALSWRMDMGRECSWEVQERPYVQFANNGEQGRVMKTVGSTQGSLYLITPAGTQLFGWADFLANFTTSAMNAPRTSTAFFTNAAVPRYQVPMQWQDLDFPGLDVSQSYTFESVDGETDFSTETLVEIAGTEVFWNTEAKFVSAMYADGLGNKTLCMRPTLSVAYWGRYADGVGLPELYPTLGYWSTVFTVGDPIGTRTFFPYDDAASKASSPVTFETSGGAMSEYFDFQERVPFAGIERDQIHRDMRTGGFITQVVRDWQLPRTGPTTPNFAWVMESMIGNASGIFPLRPLLNAWIARGGTAPAGTKMMIAGRLPTGLFDTTRVRLI